MSNVLGVLAVTKAFLPLLRKGRGRIVNVSSGHGLLAIPDKSVYAASKFAVQAINDSLRVELVPFGVQVSSVVVGKVETEVLGKIEASRREALASAPPETVSLYQPLLDYFDAEVKDLPSIPAEQAASVAAEALTESLVTLVAMVPTRCSWRSLPDGAERVWSSRLLSP
jgi:short-subunit dehydrogenase